MLRLSSFGTLGNALKAKLLSGELNADGAGCLCKEACRELGIRRAEREAARLVRCDSECCGLCECGSSAGGPNLGVGAHLVWCPLSLGRNLRLASIKLK